ncbi:hypothetical protein Dsin_012080 [Dipteronia sinensis]|uniref:KIB1-4 beta-propeller domain-containing protein n=1 Tax=Dipteronia sinensis TaxID=43782 RepID=A0AAE0E934_9ROSI|nr:hypothetical protein Dsin_012080 [Dipteronia sinensis]
MAQGANKPESLVPENLWGNVFEVELSTNNWTKMKDLGNKTLFLGSNSSICIESDGVYCKPNRLFFKDAYMNVGYFNKKGGYHMRVYNIEDRSIEPYSTNVH